jgi:hypothetical protein
MLAVEDDEHPQDGHDIWVNNVLALLLEGVIAALSA